MAAYELWVYTSSYERGHVWEGLKTDGLSVHLGHD